MNIRYPIYEGVYRILTLQLQSKDSTNIFNQSDNGRKRSEE